MASAILAKMVYTAIPSAPTLTTPVTITDANSYAAGFFNKTLFTSGNDAILSGAFPTGFNLRDPGTFRVVNAAGASFGTTSLSTQHGFTTNNTNPTAGSIYGLNAANPFYVQTQPAGAGGAQNGFQLSSGAGTNWTIQNTVVDGTGASGLTANFGTGTQTYGNLSYNFHRAFNTGQEGVCYSGNTSGTIDRITSCTITDCMSWTSGREGCQVEHSGITLINHVTCFLTGQNGTAGQNYGRQWQDNLGVSVNNIFMRADGPAFNLATHGSTFRNEYYSFFGNGGVSYSFMGRTDIVYAGSPNQTGAPVIFEYCHFEYLGTGTIPYLVQIEERGANIIFRNCTFSSNITAIYFDNRVAGFTNTLSGTIGTLGNAYATVAVPTFINFTPTDFDNHGKIADSATYHRGWGYRNPGGMSIAA